MTKEQVLAEHFRQAEVSCVLEGLDSKADLLYQVTKARVISEEIDADEMMRLLREDSKMRQKKVTCELAIAN